MLSAHCAIGIQIFSQPKIRDSELPPIKSMINPSFLKLLGSKNLLITNRIFAFPISFTNYLSCFLNYKFLDPNQETGIGETRIFNCQENIRKVNIRSGKFEHKYHKICNLIPSYARESHKQRITSS